MARYMGPRIINWIEAAVEERLKLSINRDKTKVVKLKRHALSLDFLGFELRHDRDLHGHGRKYLNTFRGKKALAKHRETLRAVTSSGYKGSLCDTILKVISKQRRSQASLCMPCDENGGKAVGWKSLSTV
jgi:hypothetical protein